MKPIDHFNTLLNALTSESRRREATPRQLIAIRHLPHPVTCLLHEGIAGIYREFDHLLLGHLNAPFVFSFNLLESMQGHHIYLKVRTKAVYELIPQQEVMACVEQKQLWQSIAYVQAHIINLLFSLPTGYAGQNSYRLICQTLTALMQEQQTIRENMSAADYIQERTLLSRAGIHNVLSALKKGNYIQVANGRLMDIRYFPDKF
ncbi:hypothetical protein EGM70_04290 [Enterobacteriaceae bacterium 89]|nr:hypothetical protein [Enterobacteriaceae bacterium 89]